MQDKTQFHKLANLFNKYREKNVFGMLVQAHNCLPLIEGKLISYIISLIKTGNFSQIGNVKSLKKLEREKDAMYQLLEIA